MTTRNKLMADRKRPPLLHVADLAFGVPLAIVPEKLDALLRGVGPRLVARHAGLDDFLNSGALVGQTVAWQDDFDDDEDDDAGITGSRRPYVISNGVAVIPVSGTLMDSGGWMSALSGCSSYEGITKAVRMAMDEDAAVSAVMFKVNSPGGSTNGCFELCDLIYNYRGKKPMYAVAKHLAASAAYAIASAADKVFVSLTGGVGSVGVFALHCDQSAADKQDGLAYKYIKFGAKKTDGNSHEPLSADAEADIQSEVDRQGMMFAERVARNRGVSRTKILHLDAAVFCGEESLPLLADSVSTYEDALSELSRKALDKSGRLSVGRSASSTSNASGESDMTTKIKAAKKRTEYEAGMKECPTCGGTGVVDDDGDESACKACDGSGQVKSEAAVPVVAPVAAAPAASVTINGQTFPITNGTFTLNHSSGNGESVTFKIADVPTSVLATATAATPTPTAPAKEDPTTMAETTALATVAAHAEIMDLCAIAGVTPDITLDFIRRASAAKDPITVETVREELRAKAIERQSKAPTAPGFGVGAGTASGAADPLSSIHQQFQVAIANAPTLKPSQVLERVIRSNPTLYAAYQNEREVAAMTTLGRESYINGVLPKFQMMGLSVG